MKQRVHILVCKIILFLFTVLIVQHAAAQFTEGNIAVFTAASSSANNTTGSIVELNASDANQAGKFYAIPFTGTNALRFSGSASSTAYLANSNDGTLLEFMGANSENTSANVNTLNPRGVGTFDATGNYNLATTYTGASGNQTRCATTLNDNDFFIGDQGGIYTNNSTSASPSGNIRGIKSFGGIVYVGQQSSTASNVQVSTIASTTGGTITALPGLINNNNFQDFYLISSGANGNAYDVLYIVSNTSSTAGTITKYSLVSGTWVSNGSYTTTFGGFGIAAKTINGGTELYVSSGNGATTANTVIKCSDNAGYNTTININTASNIILYTAAAGTTVKGVAFAPRKSIRITEYMYSGANGEFTEFTNIGAVAVDMTGWSFDDNSRMPGSTSLSAFGIVQPGESVILTEGDASAFRAAWNLCGGIKVIGNNTQNLGRDDEMNIYDASDSLVDRLTYGDDVSFPGTIRTQNISGYVNAAALGANMISQWKLSAVNDAESSYTSSGGDVGNPGKTSVVATYDACSVINGAPTIAINVDSTTNYLDGGDSTSPSSPFTVSGVINDPTDPASTLGINFTIGDDETDVDSLVVTTGSSNQFVVTNSNIIVSGSGASRNVKIIPTSVGYSNITVSVNDGMNTTSYVVSYAASAASATPDSTYWHTGLSDASDGVALDSNYYVTGDDELDYLNVYSRTHSGLQVASYDYSTLLSLPDPSKPEVDVEAATRSAAVSNRVYFMGSMSNGKAPFDNKPNRDRLFATTITGTGDSTSFSIVGYGAIRSSLLAWGDANGYSFSSSAAAGVNSKTDSGFAAEGMVFAPDNTTLYIGLRAPLVPAANRTKAVIAPILNFETWFNNGNPVGDPTYGAPIELDLGQRGIRDLDRLSNGTFIIVAGSSGDTSIPAIYKWSGNAGDAPQLVTDTFTDAALNLEGAMEVTENGNPSISKLQVISDYGDYDLYNDGSEAKDFGALSLRKFRSDILNNLDLTLCAPTTGDTTAVACGSFTWYGTTYTQSGTATHVLISVEGCDSTVTLHLTINQPPIILFTSGTIGCYGGTTYLTINASGGTAPYLYSVNGKTARRANSANNIKAGIYAITVTDAATCSVTQKDTIVQPAILKAKVSQTRPSCRGGNDGVLQVNASGGSGSYVYSINGGSFTPNNTFSGLTWGTYNLAVRDANGCTTSSSVILHDGTGKCQMLIAGSQQNTIADASTLKVKVSPNPSSTSFVITTESINDAKVELTVTDMYGRLVFKQTGNANDQYRFGENFASGMYMVKLVQGANSQTIKLIKSR